MSQKNSIKERLQENMKEALRAGKKEQLGVIRFILAALKRQEIDQQIELDEQQTLAILEKLAKQHHDSIDQYGKAGRQDLAEKEQFELTVLQSYMPKPLSDQELDNLVQAAITTTGAVSIRDMSKVMQYIKTQAQGRVDMQVAGQKIKSVLNN